MLIDKDEKKKFINLYTLFLDFVSKKNEKLQDVLGTSPDSGLNIKVMSEARDYFADNRHLLDEFIKTNPYNFSEEDFESSNNGSI